MVTSLATLLVSVFVLAMDSWTRVFFADGQGRRQVKPLTSCRVSSDVERPWNVFILSESLALNESFNLALRAN